MNILINHLVRGIDHIEKKELTFSSFFFTFFAIVIVRTILEFSLEGKHFIIHNESFYHNVVDFIHIFFSWFSLYLIISYIIFIFSNKKFIDVIKFTLITFSVILIVPLLDYFIFGSGKILYNYDFSNFIYSYFNLFNPFASIDFVTTGVRYEVFLVLSGSFLYIYYFSRAKFLSVVATFLIYNTIFIYGYLPAFYVWSLDTSFEGIVERGLTLNKSVIILNLYIYIPILFGIIFKALENFDRERRAIVYDFIRIERLSIYLALFLFGFFISVKSTYIEYAIFNLFDIFKVVTAILAISFTFFYSVILNNIVDLNIDKITNRTRPLVVQSISLNEYRDLKNIFLFVGLILSVTVNETFFFLMIFIAVLSYLYSSSFFRLKRYLMINNLTLALIALSVFLAGLSLIEGNSAFIVADKVLLTLIFLFFFIGANLKDIKDERGDRLDNITTLVTLYGQEKTLKIVKIALGIILVVFAQILSLSLLFQAIYFILFFVGSYFITQSEKYLLFIQVMVIGFYVFFLIM